MASTIPPVVEFSFRITGGEDIARRYAKAGEVAQKHLRFFLNKAAIEIESQAKRLAPVGKTQDADNKMRLRDMIGYRFTMGRSGIKKEEGDRVVVRADAKGRGAGLKAKAWAIEMGHNPNIQFVRPHNRVQRGNGGMLPAHGRRIPYYKSWKSPVKGSTIVAWRQSGFRTTGGVPVKGYKRRFDNAPRPFMRRAAALAKPAVDGFLMYEMPRRLARLLSGDVNVNEVA